MCTLALRGGASLLDMMFLFASRRGLVPLHNACSYGHYEVTELLLKVRGTRENSISSSRQTNPACVHNPFIELKRLRGNEDT